MEKPRSDLILNEKEAAPWDPAITGVEDHDETRDTGRPFKGKNDKRHHGRFLGPKK